jgi:hypothetical protein
MNLKRMDLINWFDVILISNACIALLNHLIQQLSIIFLPLASL